MANGNSGRTPPLWSKKVTDSRNKSIFLDIYSGQYGPYLVVVDSIRNKETGEYERVRTMHSPEMTDLLAYALAEAVSFFNTQGSAPPASAPPAAPPARSTSTQASAPTPSPSAPPARRGNRPSF